MLGTKFASNSPSWNPHTCQEKGKTIMRYCTVEVKEKTWEELEKISEIKKLTPNQLIGDYIEKGVKEDYVATILNG